MVSNLHMDFVKKLFELKLNSEEWNEPFSLTFSMFKYFDIACIVCSFAGPNTASIACYLAFLGAFVPNDKSKATK